MSPSSEFLRNTPYQPQFLDTRISAHPDESTIYLQIDNPNFRAFIIWSDRMSCFISSQFLSFDLIPNLYVGLSILCAELTHRGRVTQICVNKITIIDSDNGLSPSRRQAIIWTNVGKLLIGPWGTNFSEILIEIHASSFKKLHLKMSSGKRRPFCLGLNVLSKSPAMPQGSFIALSVCLLQSSAFWGCPLLIQFCLENCEQNVCGGNKTAFLKHDVKYLLLLTHYGPRSGSTLAQVIVCFLTAPNHCLN